MRYALSLLFSLVIFAAPAVGTGHTVVFSEKAQALPPGTTTLEWQFATIDQNGAFAGPGTSLFAAALGCDIPIATFSVDVVASSGAPARFNLSVRLIASNVPDPFGAPGLTRTKIKVPYRGGNAGVPMSIHGNSALELELTHDASVPLLTVPGPGHRFSLECQDAP